MVSREMCRTERPRICYRNWTETKEEIEMAGKKEWGVAAEVKEVMERFVEKFPGLFSGFDVDGIDFIETKGKKAPRALKLHARRYPDIVFHGQPYIVEEFGETWNKLDAKRRNLETFHVMCSIPVGGFDPESEFYGRRVKPDIQMFMAEFAVCGGVPNWQENPAAVDPMDSDEKAVAKTMVPSNEDPIPASANKTNKKVPVTAKDIANV